MRFLTNAADRTAAVKRYSSARSVHSLDRPYEKAEPAGIRPIAKRFWRPDAITVQMAELLL